MAPPPNAFATPAASLSQRLTETLEANEKLSNKLKKVQETGEAKAGLVVTGAIIVVTEGALGYMRGRYGEKKLFDVPAEVVGGIGAELAAISGLVGKHAETVATVGHGALGFATAMEMMKLGERAARDDARELRPAPAQQSAAPQVIDAPSEPVRSQGAPQALPDKTRQPIRTMADDVAPVEVQQKRRTGT